MIKVCFISSWAIMPFSSERNWFKLPFFICVSAFHVQLECINNASWTLTMATNSANSNDRAFFNIYTLMPYELNYLNALEEEEQKKRTEADFYKSEPKIYIFIHNCTINVFILWNCIFLFEKMENVTFTGNDVPVFPHLLAHIDKVAQLARLVSLESLLVEAV